MARVERLRNFLRERPADRVLPGDAAGGRRPPGRVPRLPGRRLQHPAGDGRGLRARRRSESRGRPGRGGRSARDARPGRPRVPRRGARAGRTRRPRRCSPSASRRGRRRTSAAPTRSATGSPSSAGRCGTAPRAPGSCPRAEMRPRGTPDGREPDDLRQTAGRGGGAGQTAGAPRLARARDLRPRSSSASAAPPTTRASSPRSIPIPTPTATRCCAVEDGLIVVLDQVQDPRNLGAVCRSAEQAGAAGLVIPERRAAEVTAVACKASAGAVEHLRDRPRPQPRRLAGRGEGGRLLDLGRRRERRRGALGRRPQGPDGPRHGRGGERPAPAGGVVAATASSPCRAAARSTPSTSRRPPRRCFSRPFASAPDGRLDTRQAR